MASTLSLRNIAHGDLARRASQVWLAAHIARRAGCDGQRHVAAMRLAEFRHDINPHIRAIARPGPVWSAVGSVRSPDGGAAA